ncbi:MAG: toprim domain-containing protein, partial [Candidatus Paceibacteria bacterium]
MKLLLVESPTKARTISRFLSEKDYKIESTQGHIRDLPSYKIGIDIEKNFEPQYVISRKRQPIVKKIKELAEKSDSLIIATDEDREGESIAWHLTEILKPKVPVKRMVFHEITREAIEEAMALANQLAPGHAEGCKVCIDEYHVLGYRDPGRKPRPPRIR